MYTLKLTERELYLIRKALNDLRTKQELSSLSCTDRQVIVFKDTVDQIKNLEERLKLKEIE
jgi:hypothetical protein